MPKKSELKKVSETYKDLTRINGKDSEIDGQIKKSKRFGNGFFSKSYKNK